MTLGGTIQEAKERLTYDEARLWMAYRQKHGGIGVTRTHFLLACLNVATNNAAGGKATLHDFLPGIPAPEPEAVADAEAFMRHFGFEQ